MNFLFAQGVPIPGFFQSFDFAWSTLAFTLGGIFGGVVVAGLSVWGAIYMARMSYGLFKSFSRVGRDNFNGSSVNMRFGPAGNNSRYIKRTQYDNNNDWGY